jgi:hypothetical protein
MSKRIARATCFAVIAFVAVGLASLSMPSAASTSTIPTRHVSATGGAVSFSATVPQAGWCVWSSTPKVPKFNGSVRCNIGTVSRSDTLAANLRGQTKTYMLTLKLVAKYSVVDHLRIVEAGRPMISTTTTTTTTLPPPPVPGGTSPNWSGYVLTGESGGYQAVSGEWTVPTLDCTSVPDGYTSDWVGVNGFGAEYPGLFQDGTTSYCANGQQTDFAWWTDEAENYLSLEVFTVAPGDVIDAEVWQETSGDWVYYVKDLTNGLVSSVVEPYSGSGLSAEWIAEDTGDPSTEGLFPLADFGMVTFTDLGLTVPSGPWTVPPYSDAVEMVSGGWVEALPSPISGTGASAAFTVTYETPGELGSTTGTVAVKHPQSTFAAPVPINIPILPQHRAGQLGVDRFPIRG